MLDILVLGATGITGRQVALCLAHHAERDGYTFGVAARSQSKLDSLAKELPNDVEKFALDVLDEEKVDQVVQNAKIVINTVGPYSLYSTPIVRACVAHAVDYVDFSGEVPWIKKIIQEFDYAATKSHTLIVTACGYDSVPSDVSVYLARKTVNESSPTRYIPLESSVTAYDVRGKISGGTAAGLMMALDHAELRAVYASDYHLSPVSGKPSPNPQLAYSLPDHSLAGGYYFMQPTNRAIVQRTWGLLEVEGQADETERTLSYGPNFTYDEFMVLPNRIIGAIFTWALGIGALLLVAIPLLRRIIVPQPGDGPNDKEMLQGYFKTTNITTTAGPEPLRVKTTISAKGDPGYYLGPRFLTEAALSIHFSKASLPKLGKRGGVLTPVTAFGDVYVERLSRNGFQIASSLISSDRKTR